MKAVIVKKPGEVVLENVQMPEPPAGFARIKVKAAAICATETPVWRLTENCREVLALLPPDTLILSSDRFCLFILFAKARIEMRRSPRKIFTAPPAVYFTFEVMLGFALGS